MSAFSRFSVVATLLLSIGAFAPAARASGGGNNLGIAIMEMGIISATSVLTTTINLLTKTGDRIETIGLVDEAYEGSGPRLTAIAKSAQMPASQVADTIVNLDKTGALSDLHAGASITAQKAAVDQILLNLAVAKKMNK